MPELPEVETIRGDLQKVLKGKTIARVVVRKPKMVGGQVSSFTHKLRGTTITTIERRGKLLIINFKTPNLHLLIHLKMTGQLIYRQHKKTIAGGHPFPPIEKLPNKYTHIEFHFTNGAVVYFNDLRQFGYARLVTTKAKDAIVGKYGIEPLTPEFTLERFTKALRGRKTQLKNVLLDQTAIAGLGNIYVDEACFFAGVKPTRTAASLTTLERKKLHRACTHIIREAIKHRGTTFSKYRDGYGERGGYVKKLKVYGRRGLECLRCHQTSIKQVKVNGRGTTYCAFCQK